MRHSHFLVFSLALALGAFFGTIRQAHAGIITRIETNLDGGGWVLLTSNAGASVGPVSGNLGVVSALTNMSAISFLPAELVSTDLILTNRTAAKHRVKIVVASTDFTDPTGPVSITSTVGGTAIKSAAGSSVTFQSYVDQGNHSDHTGEVGAFTTGLQLTSFPNGSTALGSMPSLAGPYSVIQAYDITLVGHDHVQFQGDTALLAAAPEPASLVLLGVGAAGLFGYGWTRRKVAA